MAWAENLAVKPPTNMMANSDGRTSDAEAAD
jgi:hypothetical protein